MGEVGLGEWHLWRGQSHTKGNGGVGNRLVTVVRASSGCIMHIHALWCHSWLPRVVALGWVAFTHPSPSWEVGRRKGNGGVGSPNLIDTNGGSGRNMHIH